MTPDELTGVLADVRRLRTRFADTTPQPWTAATAAAELTVQLGHLALCLLHRHSVDTADLDDPIRPIANVGDELADVLLAGLSVPVLAGMEPHEMSSRRPDDRDGDTAQFLRLVVTAGQLAEAAMMHDGLRHQPAGTPPTISDTSARVVTATGTLAEGLGLDLHTEFQAMVVDATGFLDSRDTAAVDPASTDSAG
jgi:cytosine/adenosine deaminase-related metal-dependent hydrolase